MNLPKLLVLDDYEGQLAAAPAMNRLRELADVTILDHPLRTQMSKGEWPMSMGSSLAGRTLGILGYGRHGRPVGRLAKAFDMNVIAWDRGSPYSSNDPGVERMPLDDLLAGSDIVSIHLRLSDESRGLINRDRIAKMKSGALLINTSRGAIVDEDALVEALQENRIAGAGLDVFAVEPLPASSPLRTMPNVLMTPWASLGIAGCYRDVMAWAPLSRIVVGSGGHGTPEIAWLAAKTAKIALAEVFEDAVRLQLITKRDAETAANMILHDNAARLYRLS